MALSIVIAEFGAGEGKIQNTCFQADVVLFHTPTRGTLV